MTAQRPTKAARRVGDELPLQRHECPDYCHPCPFLRGAIMPMCYGTIGGTDDLDLTRCSCDPCDPNIAKSELAEYALRLIGFFRSRRRARLRRNSAVYELEKMARALSFMPTVHDVRRAAPRIAELAMMIRQDVEGIYNDGPQVETVLRMHPLAAAVSDLQQKAKEK